MRKCRIFASSNNSKPVSQGIAETKTMKNINEQEIKHIELIEECNKYQIEYLMADVNNLYNATYERIWGYLEIATANHQLKEMKKYIKVAEQLEKIKVAEQLERIKESIWSVESVTTGYRDINYFPQFVVLRQQQIKLINL